MEKRRTKRPDDKLISYQSAIQPYVIIWSDLEGPYTCLNWSSQEKKCVARKLYSESAAEMGVLSSKRLAKAPQPANRWAESHTSRALLPLVSSDWILW